MKKLTMLAAMTAFAAFLLGACSPSDDAGGDDEAAGAGAAEGPNPTRNAYFGDLHVHTRYSFDAFIFGTTTDPNDAYEFAKGGTIKHPAGFDMQLDRPLDFQAVADHGMYLGMLPAMTEEDSPVYGHPIAADLRVAEEADERRGIFVGMGPYLRGDPGTEEHLNMDVVRGAWSKIVEAAEVHNDPGNFTAFIGYEFTSSGYERDNLHRNVIFRGSEHPDAPFSRLDSQNPEDLWAAMDGWRDQGIEALAIPHNSNGSGGRMFEMEKFYGDPFDDEYSDVRMRNEPIVEMTQVKGTSDTHPALSPNDEWADFEIMPYKIATTIISDPPGSYVRDALIRGLRLADGGLDEPVQVRPHRRQRHPRLRRLVRGGQLLVQGRDPGRRAAASRLRARHRRQPDAGRCDPAVGRGDAHRRRLGPHLPRHLLLHLGRLRPRRRLGRGEHPRGDLRRHAAQGDLRHLRPAHQDPLLRRRLRRRRPGRRRVPDQGLRRGSAHGRRPAGHRCRPRRRRSLSSRCAIRWGRRCSGCR